MIQIMKQTLINLTLLVYDYDKAIAYYTEKLGFDLVEDTKLSETKRWVRIRPPGSNGCCLLLAKAHGKEQEQQVGNQCGGRVFLFLETDNFDRDHECLINKGVNVIDEPRQESYGTVLVFEDLYGNKFDLIEPKR